MFNELIHVHTQMQKEKKNLFASSFSIANYLYCCVLINNFQVWDFHIILQLPHTGICIQSLGIQSPLPIALLMFGQLSTLDDIVYTRSDKNLVLDATI